jgi:lactoylglutathione lyase
MRATRFNHVSIHANDLEQSVHFYTEVFGMERVPAPSFRAPVAWLRLGEQQLHLFVRETPAPQFHHIALDIDDFEAAYLKAQELGIRDDETWIEGVYELPDGAAQMYIRDPAGNLVELDWPDASTLDRSIVTDVRRLEDVRPQPPEAAEARLYLRSRAHTARTSPPR